MWNSFSKEVDEPKSFKFKKAWRTYCRLMKSLFAKERDYEVQRNKQLRAWQRNVGRIFYILLLTPQTFQIWLEYGELSGKPDQCSDEITTECIKDYNRELMDPLDEPMRNAIKLHNFIMIILLCVSFKYSSVINYFIYMECLWAGLLSMTICRFNYEAGVFRVMISNTGCAVFVWCGGGVPIVVSCVFLAYFYTFTAIGFNKDINVQSVAIYVVSCILQFLFITTYAMII